MAVGALSEGGLFLLPSRLHTTYIIPARLTLYSPPPPSPTSPPAYYYLILSHIPSPKSYSLLSVDPVEEHTKPRHIGTTLTHPRHLTTRDSDSTPSPLV
jgi:hypothetical protein